MPLIEYEHVVQALGSDRSHPALGDRVGPRRSERRASLDDTKIAHPPIEAAAITVVAVMNEEAWRLAVPTAAFDDLLCRPRGGRMRRHMHVENLPAGVMDDEEDVECPKEDRLDAEETLHVLGDGSGRKFEPEPRQFGLDPSLSPQLVLSGHTADESP